MPENDESQAVVVQEEQLPADPQAQLTPATPADLLLAAIEKGVEIDVLERLMALQERWEEKRAEQAFLDAMSEFQRNMPVMEKTEHVSYQPRGRDMTVDYSFTPLAVMAHHIKHPLADAGLSFRWEIGDVDTHIKVSCIVSHRDGHSVTVTMLSEIDDTGSKNKVQSRASTVTYLQRYTLVGALGITTGDTDTDGIASGGQGQEETPEEKQRKDRVGYDVRAKAHFGDDVDALISDRYDGTHIGGLRNDQIIDFIKYLDEYDHFAAALEVLEEKAGPEDGDRLFSSNEPPVDSDGAIWLLSPKELKTLTTRMEHFIHIKGAADHFDTKIYRALLGDLLRVAQREDLADCNEVELAAIRQRFIKEFREAQAPSEA